MDRLHVIHPGSENDKKQTNSMLDDIRKYDGMTKLAPKIPVLADELISTTVRPANNINTAGTNSS